MSHTHPPHPPSPDDEPEFENLADYGGRIDWSEWQFCNSCLEWLESDAFPWLDESLGILGNYCYPCIRQQRREWNRKTRPRRRRKKTLAHLAKLDRARGLIRIAELLDNLAIRFGGWRRTIGRLLEIAEDEKTSDYDRLRVCRTLLNVRLQIASIGLDEKSPRREQPAETPAEQLLRLHRRRELIPELRAMIATGLIDLDDIDPPPYEPPT